MLSSALFWQAVYRGQNSRNILSSVSIVSWSSTTVVTNLLVHVRSCLYYDAILLSVSVERLETLTLVVFCRWLPWLVKIVELYASPGPSIQTE